MNIYSKINLENNPLNLELVRELLGKNQNLEITYGFIENELLEKLITNFENYYVNNISIYKKLIISECIPTTAIIKNKDLIFNAAKLYRVEANELMQELSSKFSINLKTLEGLHELKFKKSVKQRGKLNLD